MSLFTTLSGFGGRLLTTHILNGILPHMLPRFSSAPASPSARFWLAAGQDGPVGVGILAGQATQLLSTTPLFNATTSIPYICSLPPERACGFTIPFIVTASLIARLHCPNTFGPQFRSTCLRR